MERALILECWREGGLDYVFLPLDHQRPPDGEWSLWLLIGGRGAGKTRAGAEWVRRRVAATDAPLRLALVSETYADGREVMIDGASGLARLGHPARRPRFEASRRRLVWPNGSLAYCFSSEEPDGLRGHEFDAAWSDELCKWRHPEETWSNLQLALRRGASPRQAVTTTPRPTALLKRLLAQKGAAITRGATFANAAHLPAAFLDDIAAQFAGTTLARQELYGELVEDVAGALWTRRLIEAARISVPAGFNRALARVVVAVDPPASEGGDECGIIVAGVLAGDPQTAYVLDDRSAGGLSPRQWASRAVEAYRAYEADRIVVEVNQGGDMARAVVEQIDPAAPVREVRARRGKRLRAEPVAALYERGLVRHVAAFPALEDQMAGFVGGAGPSPDRLDALVWALTELMLGREGAPQIRRIE
jgi:phage terminase large subunit-like protein